MKLDPVLTHDALESKIYVSSVDWLISLSDYGENRLSPLSFLLGTMN